VRWSKPSPTICWEASDQRRGRERHSERVAFVLSDGSFAALDPHCIKVTVVPSVYLQAEASACTIKVAYQAAEAPPIGERRLAAQKDASPE
jgi:hypothetical protein